MGSGGSKLTPEEAVAKTRENARSAFRSEPGVIDADSPAAHNAMVVTINGTKATVAEVMTLTGPLTEIAATAEFLLDNTVKRAWGVALYNFHPDPAALRKLSPKQDWSKLMSYSKEWVVMTTARMSLDATEAVAEGTFTPGGDPKHAAVKLKLEAPKPLPRGSYAIVVAYVPEGSLPDDIFKTLRTPPIAVRLFHIL